MRKSAGMSFTPLLSFVYIPLLWLSPLSLHTSLGALPNPARGFRGRVSSPSGSTEPGQQTISGTF